MTDIITLRYDYSGLPAETADALRRAAVDARSSLSNAGSAFEVAGKRLIEAKAMLTGRGQFGAWVRAELGLEERTAENYMSWSRFMDGAPKQFSALPISLVYRLASKSAPPAVVQEVVAAAEAGTPLLPKEIKRRLADHRETKRQIDHIVTHSKAKVRPTREQAEEQICQRQIEQKKLEDRRFLDEAMRDARLLPVVGRAVATWNAALLAEIKVILIDHDAGWRFRDLLVKAIKDAPDQGRVDEADAEPDGEPDAEPAGEIDVDLGSAETLPDLLPSCEVEVELVDEVEVEVEQVELVAEEVELVATVPEPEASPAPVTVQADPEDQTGWRRMANDCLSSGVQFGTSDIRLLTAFTGLEPTLPTAAGVDRLEVLYAGLPLAQGGVQ